MRDWGCIFVTAALGVTYPVFTVFYFILICDVWHFEGFACCGHDGKHLNHTRNIKNCQVKHQSCTGGWGNKVSSDLSVVKTLRASLALGSLTPLHFRSGAGNAIILTGFKRFYQILTSVVSQEEILPTISQRKTSHCEKWLVFVVLHLYAYLHWGILLCLLSAFAEKTHQNTSVIFKNKSIFLIFFLHVKKIPANEKNPSKMAYKCSFFQQKAVSISNLGLCFRKQIAEI